MRKLPSLVITSLAIAALLAGCSSPQPEEVVDTPSPEITTPAPVEPSPSVEPVIETGPYFGVEVTQEQVQQYIDEPIEQFTQRSIEERAPVAVYFAEQMDIQQFAADYYSVSNDPNDILPEAPAITNSPQEALAIAGTFNRMLFCVPDADNDHYLDTESAVLLNSAVRFDGLSSKWLFPYSDDLYDQERAARPKSMAATGAMAYPEILSVSDLQTNGQGYSYYSYEIVGNDGSPVETDVYWVPVGEGGIWITE